MPIIFAFPAVILLFLTAAALLISRDWRVSIGALALQYLGMTILVSLSWEIEEAVVKLVAGWMAGAVLGLALLSLPEEAEPEESQTASFVLFKVLLAVLAGLVAFSLADTLADWLSGLSDAQAAGGLLLIGLGLLHLGLTTRPFRVILGLLTVLGGFEILYAAVEDSILVAGLLTTITLGLAMAGSYLLAVSFGEELEG